MQAPLRFSIPALTFLRTVLNTAYRLPYPFLPVFARGLGITPELLASLLGVRSLVSAFGPFLATFTDQYGRRAGFIAGIGAFSSGGLLAGAGLLPGLDNGLRLVSFGGGMLLIALGKAIFDPTAHAFIGDRVPYAVRGRAVAIFELSWSLSFIIGVPLAGWLMDRAGWAAPFPLLAGIGLIGLLPLLWGWRRRTTQDRPAGLTLRGWLAMFARRAPLAALTLSFCFALANELVNLVFGVWLEARFDLNLAGLGIAAAAIGFAELAGEGLVAGLSDRLGKPLSVASGIIGNILAAILLPILAFDTNGALIGLVLFYVTAEIIIVASLSMMTEVAPGARAAMLAASVGAVSLGRFTGSLIGPQLYLISQEIAFLNGIGLNVLVSMAVNLAALAALWVLQRNLSHSSGAA